MQRDPWKPKSSAQGCVLSDIYAEQLMGISTDEYTGRRDWKRTDCGLLLCVCHAEIYLVCEHYRRPGLCCPTHCT